MSGSGSGLSVPFQVHLPEGEHDAEAVAAYTARFAGLFQAARLVGDEAGAHLAWLVGFARADATRWHPSAIAAHGDALQVFAGQVGMPSNFRGGIDLPAPLDEHTVRDLQAALAELVQEAVTAKTGAAYWPQTSSASDPLCYQGVETALVRMTPEGEKPASWGKKFRGPLRPLVLARAQDLIVRVGSHLVACGFCKAPFIAVKRQEYCSLGHAQKQRNLRKAKRKEEAEAKAKGRGRGAGRR